MIEACLVERATELINSIFLEVSVEDNGIGMTEQEM